MIVRITFAVAIIVAFVLVTVFLVRGSRGAVAFHRWAGVLFPLSQLIVMVPILYAMIRYNWPLSLSLFAVAMGAACAASDIALLSALRTAQGKELAQDRVRLLDEQVELQERYFERLQTELQEARGIRTHMIDELEQARAYLTAEKPESAVQQMRQAVSSMGTGRQHMCENQVVDALASMKADVCVRHGIRLTCDMDVPDDITLPDADLCAVFSNILDNAIQGCLDVDEDRRSIVLRARVAKGYLTAVCENSCANAGTGAPIAKRQGSKLSEHGWGLAILQTLAERHEGMFKAERHDTTFRSTATLKVHASAE